jgi:pyridoxal phosphate enzyme (YggS family)
MVEFPVQEDFKDRLERVKERIEHAARAAGRDPGEVRLIAATKTVSVERLRKAVAYGCRTFGENRVQEAVAKMEAVAETPGLEWHFLGPLQSNKIKLILGRFALLHAIDRMEVAEYLDRVLRDRDMHQAVLLEVNVSAEPSKHGFSPEALREVAHKMANFKSLRIRGLMTIAPPATSSEGSRPYFHQLRILAAQIESERIPGIAMKELSMGMSADFECAVQEGATMVRIGTALFGPRERPRPSG